jgi:cysteinyl-tRNA synthetase
MYAFIQWDTMVRFFRYLGFKVNWVVNITDVGHLTSDADAGQDKMEKGAKRENLSVWEVAEKYIEQFTDSLELLNITRPDVLPRATKHIDEQIELIKKIDNNGFTYQTKTGLVFDTAKFKGYPKFARLDLDQQAAGARVEVDPEKKNPWDFLLWVTNQPEHAMQWDSPWGRGFPGWHIECTAMSTKYLGERFDIHTGGQEHIAVHHTNEIAQGYGAFGHQTARYWLHNAWLRVKDEKMSKSKGSFYTAQDLAAKGYDPLAFRLLVLTTHYRKGINFTWEALESSASALERLREITGNLNESTGQSQHLTSEKLAKVEKYRQAFLAALADDLKYPEALAVVWEMVKSNIAAVDKRDLLGEFDQVLGLELNKTVPASAPVAVPPAVRELGEKRESLRQAKKWQAADKLRRQMTKLGWSVRDTASGPEYRPVSLDTRSGNR